MPCERSSAPAVFQCLINDVLQDMLGKLTIAYLDDILIYSPDQAAHVLQVKNVFSRVLKYLLYIKGEKCKVHVHMVAFLGYIIRPEGLLRG